MNPTAENIKSKINKIYLTINKIDIAKKTKAATKKNMEAPKVIVAIFIGLSFPAFAIAVRVLAL